MTQLCKKKSKKLLLGSHNAYYMFLGSLNPNPRSFKRITFGYFITSKNRPKHFKSLIS